MIFHSYFNHPWQYFITSGWQEMVGCWSIEELVHHPWQYLFTYSYEGSFKKYHHSDILYHKTLNIIFSALYNNTTYTLSCTEGELLSSLGFNKIWANQPKHSFLVGCLYPCLQGTNIRVVSPQPINILLFTPGMTINIIFFFSWISLLATHVSNL